MATTELAVFDRVRDVVTALGFDEAPATGFELTPGQVTRRPFIAKLIDGVGIGQIGWGEEVRGTVEVRVWQLTNDDANAARRTLYEDLRSVVNAIARDGADSGLYAVGDDGREVSIEAPKGTSYLIGTARLGVNFEVDL